MVAAFMSISEAFHLESQLKVLQYKKNVIFYLKIVQSMKIAVFLYLVQYFTRQCLASYGR